MFTNEKITYYKYLFENIFEELADDSKEFLTFVNDENPHPLRVKIDDAILSVNDEILKQCNSANDNVRITEILGKMSLIHELDTVVMTYIENNSI
jgi:hypothetical protein